MANDAARVLIQRLGASVTEIRTNNRWSQHELSRRSGVSQSTISRLERGRLPDPSVAVIASLIEVMGGRLRIEVDSPFLSDRRRQVDPAHARMCGCVRRRLEKAGWAVATEVEIGVGRGLGWIDLLACNRATRRLLVIEVKSEIHDIGRIDRTLGMYERDSWIAARRQGWRPSAVTGCLVLLLTQANDDAVRFNRDVLAGLFPIRATELARLIDGTAIDVTRNARALAMIDPRSRRRTWLRPTTMDGRRSAAPYADYAHFMRVLRAR